MPMLTNLADVVRTSGLPVFEDPGWKTRGHGGMSGVKGVVCHHTAGPATGNSPSLSVVRSGRTGLAGPLAHIVLGRDGTAIIVAAGLAYHAGAGSGFGLPANGANAWMLGIEAESTGSVAGDWTPQQVNAYPRLVAALAAGYGFSLSMAIAHYEWAPTRKVDPRGFPGGMAAIRSGVGPGPTPAAPSGHPVLQKGSTGSAVKTLQSFLGGLVVDGAFGDATRAAVVAYQAGVGLAADGVVGAQTWAKIDAGARPAAKPVSQRSAAASAATQRAVHAAADGYWGDDTERRVNLVRSALNGLFPQGVAVTQGVVGTAADGAWGPKSKAALKATVASLQAAWGTGADGVWGPKTEAAWVSARAKNYKTW